MQSGCAALHMAPQAARIAADPGAASVVTSGTVDLEAFKVACDVWALAVALYYMLFCRFPFSRGEVGAWAGQAAPQWDGDAGVTYTSAHPLPLCNAADACAHTDVLATCIGIALL